MITNERQFRSTKANAEKLRNAIDSFDRNAALSMGIDPIIVEAQIRSLASLYQDLLDQIRAYEAAKDSPVEFPIAKTISEISDVLIRARLAQNLTQRELGERLGLKEQQIQRYEAERFRGASLQRLAQFIDALGIRVEIDAKLENDLVPSSTRDLRKFVAEGLKSFPLSEMKKRQWFGMDGGASKDTKTLLLEFFSDAFGDRSSVPLFRRSLQANMVDTYALLAWQARVLQKARHAPKRAAPMMSNSDSSWIGKLVRLSTEPNGPKLAKEFLDSVGIILVIERHLPKTHLDGAAMLLDGKYPVIGMTLRFDRLDNFWFVLLHEIAHILLHHKEDLIDGFFDDEFATENDELERQANEFAQTALIPDEIWNNSFVRFAKSSSEIKRFAERVQISPAVVAGRIRRERDTAATYAKFSDLLGHSQVRVQFKDEMEN